MADYDSDSEYEWMFMSDIRKVKAGGAVGKPNYDDLSAWTKYDAENTLALEKGYLTFKSQEKPTKKHKELVMKSGKIEYVVRFDDGEGGMRQYRKTDEMLQRPVQRRKKEKDSGASTPRAKSAVKRKEADPVESTPPAKKKRGASAKEEGEEEEFAWYFMHDIRKVKLGGEAGKPNYEDLSAWTRYDDAVNKKLEAGYQLYLEEPTKKHRTMTVKGAGKKIEYTVSFAEGEGGMRQWRSDDPDRQRPVQRRIIEDGVPVPSPKKTPTRS